MQSVVAVCAASLAIGQAAIALCGRAALVLARAGGRAGAALRALLGDGAAARATASSRRVGRAGADRCRGRSTCGDGSRAGAGARARAGRWRCSRCSRPRCPSPSKGTSGSSAPASTRTCPSTCWRPTGSPTAHGSQLLHQGYPLGPHAIVVALNKGLGIGLVQGFDGLTVAVAVLAVADRPRRLRELPPLRRTAGALLVGLAYMVASYFAQGAFKETMQALFVLAFVARRCGSRRANRGWRDLPARASSPRR